MNGEEKRKFLRAQREVKKRYKMYKAKKNWVCAPILFLGIAGGFFTSSRTVSANELEQTAIEMREQVQDLLSIKTAKTEVQALDVTQEQSENLKPNTEIATKENAEAMDQSEISEQKLINNQNKQLVSDEKNSLNTLSNENINNAGQLTEVNDSDNEKNGKVKNEENHSRMKRDNLIKVGLNNSSTIEVNRKTNYIKSSTI